LVVAALNEQEESHRAEIARLAKLEKRLGKNCSNSSKQQ